MCDVIAVVRPKYVLFAKNSDRDPNEAQVLEWHPRRSHAEGARVKCTWIEVPQAAETYATVISRPFWMWGAEMGANEHGVAIGNVAVFTTQPYAKEGLTGMDLLRLALERSDSAKKACAIITDLLLAHGQGGGCGHENRAFTYHNSFIIADPTGAFVLETAGSEYAIEKLERGGWTISNRLTLPGFAEKHSDRFNTWLTKARCRQPRTHSFAFKAHQVSQLMAVLRDHGESHANPRYSLLHGGAAAPCMHAGGLLRTAQTTASWVAELRPDSVRHWVTATAAPCVGLFKPVSVTQPLDLGPAPGDVADDSLWWRHERLHRLVMRNPEALRPLFIPDRNAVEARWLRDPPANPRDAFAEADGLLKKWLGAVKAKEVKEARPRWVRRYWDKRTRRVGLEL